MNLLHRARHYVKHSFFLAGLASIAWLVFRSGTKPSRALYPCQQAAAATGYLWAATYIGLPLVSLVSVRRFARPGKAALLVAGILATATVFSALYIAGGGAEAGTAGTGIPDIALADADAIPDAGVSDIYFVKGRSVTWGVSELIGLMRSDGREFYRNGSAPGGIIGPDDVVLVKVNSQWPERGGTNTDLVKEIVRAVLAHPDGFTGEIVIVDNGQGRGSFNWPDTNAADRTQSIRDVAGSFSATGRVSTFLWDTIRLDEVGEYASGDNRDGYVVIHVLDPETGMRVSYPKFTTVRGTRISLRRGVWNGTGYNSSRLKLLNVPVLKSHGGAGVTASIKHYVGVMSVEKTSQGHDWLRTGGLGTEMVESRFPDLTIVDANWVNAIPAEYDGHGPGTTYGAATRQNTLVAGTDPVALDYFSARRILMPLAAAKGYGTASMNPDYVAPGSFGSLLRLARGEIRRAGYQATLNPALMDVHVAAFDAGAAYKNDTIPSPIRAGRSRTVTVTMKNAGNLTWSPENGIVLRAAGGAGGAAAQFSDTVIPMAPGSNVTRGGKYTFAFTMTAPGTPATYDVKYRMYRTGLGSFGPVVGKTVKVVPP